MIYLSLFTLSITLTTVFSAAISIVKDIPKELAAHPDKFIFAQNLITGEKYIHDLRAIDKPSPIKRIRLMFSTSQAVNADNDPIEVFHMKLRWIDPDYWNDNFTEEGRSYKILCEIEDETTGQTRNFLALTMPAVFNGYDEKYLFPKMPLVARCSIRVENSAHLESDWSVSAPVQLYPSDETASAPLKSEMNDFSKKFFNERIRRQYRNRY